MIIIRSAFEDDLYFIEKALADEISFLFYVGLLRANNHVASDHSLTTDFMRSNLGFQYPNIAGDDQIRNK
ncbi:MAG: hypothetical protein WA323_18510, partial [Candidatus Nitrosopolaris sp.]